MKRLNIKWSWMWSAAVFGMLLGPLLYSAARTSNQEQIDAILNMQQPPPGIVFELLGGDDMLTWAIPAVSGYIQQLHARFPKLEIAVVSHGMEQFALMKAERENFTRVHTLVEQLSVKQDIAVHICGTFAEMNGVGAEAFPAYVDVAPAGPAQIGNYRELGYQLIQIRR